MNHSKIVLMLFAFGCAPGFGFASSFNIIYTFPSQTTGLYPAGTPYIGSGGVLIATTAAGGTPCTTFPLGCGTVFSLSPPSTPGGSWIQATLFSFSGVDGAQPETGVIPGLNGSLAGTTSNGGPANTHCRAGCGTFFQLTPPTEPGGIWTEEVLYDFLKADFEPNALLAGPNGVFFGAALFGGNMGCSLGCGSLYELTPPSEGGTTWTLSPIHQFAFSTGDYPNTPLIAGANGVLYGTAEGGGNMNLKECDGGCGTVFSLTPPVAPATAWTFQDIYRFRSGSDGYIPQSGLVLGADGTLYGTTYYGGGSGCAGGGFVKPVADPGPGCGTVFSLTPPTAGGLWTEAVLYSFQGGTADGSFPESQSSNLVIRPGGVLYGVTTGGGGSGCFGQGCGVLYELAPPSTPGGSWTETILHIFTGGADGENPYSGPAIDSTGVLYGFANGGTGTACSGGGCGVVYQYIP
jgi:hypothetical protein